MKYNTNANIQKEGALNTTFYKDMLHKIYYRNKVHKNTTMMGLEKPWDDPLVILEVVSIKGVQVLVIHGKF